jgi:hypothetical protein
MRTLLALFLLISTSAFGQAVAPWCGEFLPMITEAWVGSPHQRVHFAPKYCNKIMVDGVIETIPPAIAVYSGGINTDVTNTCIDKVCGQPLKPNMLYRAYVFKDGSLKINFSVTEHKEGPYGNEVNAEDPSQSFIGLVKTEDSGRICGGMNLCILSWFYRGHTGLGDFIGPAFGKPLADVCSATLQPTAAAVTVLTFGINSVFRQGYTVPNIYASGTLTNSEVGKASHAAIGIEWAGTPVTFAAGSPGVVTWSHYAGANIGVGTALAFASDGVLPSPLTTAGTYYVQAAVDANTFTLTNAPGGPAIPIASDGSGKHIVIVKNRQAGPRTAGFRSAEGNATALHAVSVGALGAEEGWIKGTLMLGAPNGGCARVPEGMIYTSPHHS